jgi:hypothetical protein
LRLSGSDAYLELYQRKKEFKRHASLFACCDSPNPEDFTGKMMDNITWIIHAFFMNNSG